MGSYGRHFVRIGEAIVVRRPLPRQRALHPARRDRPQHEISTGTQEQRFGRATYFSVHVTSNGNADESLAPISASRIDCVPGCFSWFGPR